METFRQDLRHAFRSLLQAPGFTLVAALTLAIGIGANTAVFSIIHAILLRPLQFRSPEQLVRLYETESAPGKYPFAGPDFVDWKTQNSTFQDMTLFGWGNDFNLSAKGSPDHIIGVPTEANFFSLLGVQPLLGRTWTAGEDQPGKNQVAVLGYALWRSRFAGDPHAVGETVELNSKKYTIVGVMPAGFRFPSQAQLWIPQDMEQQGPREPWQPLGQCDRKVEARCRAQGRAGRLDHHRRTPRTALSRIRTTKLGPWWCPCMKTWSASRAIR